MLYITSASVIVIAMAIVISNIAAAVVLYNKFRCGMVLAIAASGFLEGFLSGSLFRVSGLGFRGLGFRVRV